MPAKSQCCGWEVKRGNTSESLPLDAGRLGEFLQSAGWGLLPALRPFFSLPMSVKRQGLWLGAVSGCNRGAASFPTLLRVSSGEQNSSRTCHCTSGAEAACRHLLPAAPAPAPAPQPCSPSSSLGNSHFLTSSLSLSFQNSEVQALRTRAE